MKLQSCEFRFGDLSVLVSHRFLQTIIAVIFTLGVMASSAVADTTVTTLVVKAIDPSRELPDNGDFTATAAMAGPLGGGLITITDDQDLTFSDDSGGDEEATSSGTVGGHTWSNRNTDNEEYWVVRNTTTNEEITIFEIDVEDSEDEEYWGATGELVQGDTYDVIERNSDPDETEGVAYADMVTAVTTTTTIGVKALDPLSVLPTTGTFVATASMAGPPDAGSISITDVQNLTFSDDSASHSEEMATSSGTVGYFGWASFGTDNEDQWILRNTQTNDLITVFRIDVEALPSSYYWGATGELIDGQTYEVVQYTDVPEAASGVAYADMLGVSSGGGSGGGGSGGGSTPPPAGSLAGATSGELGVSPAGAASYSIPISVPPGTTGLQPSLTLQYSSQAGNGIMGVGWSIGGLSSISRCGTDIHNDQTIDPVDFETDDKLCMNGERLVPIVGTNGADGTEYRTQQEEFSKVISYGSAGTGPAWFKVWKKSGQIFEYGNTVDSRVEASGRSEARAWMLNRISDQRGNYMEFVYTEDSALGRLSLAQVNYTGNAAQSLAPYNSVVFDYEARPDTSKAYLAGTVIEQHQRLQKVRVLAGATQVRDYTVGYEISGTGRSRPISVTECGVGGTDCFAPTVFEWSADGAGKFILLSLGASEGLLSSSYDERRIIASGDFNNDGLTDFYMTRTNSGGLRKNYGSNKGKIWLSDGDGTFTWSNQEYADGLRNDQQVIATGDFDGDGYMDIYVAESRDDGRLDGGGDADAFLFGDGAGGFNRVVANEIGSSMRNWGVGAVGDFNGDGLTDLYLYHQDDKRRAAETVIGTETVTATCGGGKDGNTYSCEITQDVYGMAPDQIWLANRVADKNVTFTKQTIDLANSISEGHEALTTGDFNGDGLIDIYTVVTDGKKAGAININGIPGADNVHLSNGPAAFVKQAVPDPDRVPDEFTIMSTGDFNGDGLTDFYLTEIDDHGHATENSSSKIRISRGDGTFINTDVAEPDRIPDFHKVLSSGDFNGDGLTDLYVSRTGEKGKLNSNSHLDDSIFLSDGKGGFTRELLPAGAGGAVTSGWAAYVVAASGDFNGDGLTDLYYWKGDDYHRSNSGDYYDYIVFSGWNPPDYLTKVTNGLGLFSEFQYKPMTDADVYTIGTGATYPENDIITAGQMVHKVVADNGIGGSNTQTYTYEGFRAHIAGVGGLGFRTMEVTDDSTGIVTESTYLQAWQTHHQGMLERSRTIAPGDIVLKDQQVTWAVSFRPGGGTDGVAQCFRYADTSTTTSRDLNGVLMSTVTETTTYDDYGYPTTLVASTAGSGKTFTKTTNNVYTHNASTWILGRLSSASVTHAATGQANITRTSSFTYEPTGEIATETVASTSGLTVTKTNAYNAFGAVTSVTETWGEPVDDGIVATSRTTSYTYDAKVRHQLTETNPLGHSETRTFDPDTGLITSTTGPNSLATSWTYDAFGRVTRETRADGTYTDTIREACGPTTFACGTDLALRTITRPQGGAESTVVADRLLRTRLSYTLVNGQLSYVNEEYDAQGRMIQKSEPYFSGNTVHWTTIQYDLLGRPIITTRPDNSTQLVTYNGLTQVATNEIGQTKTVTKDAIGQTVSVTDNASNVTSHVYDAIGQMTSMSGPLGNTSTYVYDDRGNKISDTDPDKGTWAYRYNALGMLVEQTDAKGQVTRITYDVLGRMLTRIDDADSAGAAARTATWTYDTGTKAIGKLVASTSGNGYASTADYDSFGRPSQATETIDGTAYTTTTTYDSFSRADSVIYPSGLRTQNVYDANGLLTEVKNYTSQASYWQLLEMDARGNVSKERLGNGVETTRTYESETGQLNAIFSVKDLTTVQDLSYTLDDLGNLTQRRDTVQNLTEDFLYDNLNRVTSIATTYGNGQATNTTVTMTYDAIGNITSKTGVGTYTYGQVHGTCAASQQYAGPNAVTQVAGTKNATYCYDANGNQTAGDGRTITYSAFDKPTQILKGANIVNVWYGPDRSRFKRQDQTTSGTTTTVYAMGGSYESIQQPSLVVEEKHYIAGVAVVSTYSNTQIAATRYLLKDNLGSLDTITDELGAIVQKMSFDAWGKRREVDWTALSGTALLAFDTSITTRGYTGHEMLDPVGLVHMNGRVYDAELGRFLSADPNIQDVENFQNWNRYTYVLNNPLSYTDPSGFFFSKIFKAIGNFFKSVFKAIGSVFKALLKIPLIRSAIQIVACGVGPITCTIAAGALTLLSGGSIIEAVQAMAFSAAQMGIWDVVGTAVTGPLSAAMGVVDGVVNAASVGFAAVKGAIHGVVGGAISVAQGGNFLEGFAANAIGASSGVFATSVSQGSLFVEAAIVSVAGGAAAVAAGGKFANGALTAAFAYLYNQRRNLRPGRREGHFGPIMLARRDMLLRQIREFEPNFSHVTLSRPGSYPTTAEITYLQSALAAVRSRNVTEGIYQFTASSGRPYVGQSSNIPARLKSHIRSGKLPSSELQNVTRTEVLGGRLNREIAEQLRINSFKGIGNMENIRNPIGPARRHLLE